MRVELVVAVTDNGVIGAADDIPWHIPGEQRRVKELTLGTTLVMGRRTFESIGRPLPGRRTVVITRDPTWRHDGVIVAGSVDDALAAAEAEAFGDRIVVFGGAQVYAQTIDRADALEVTHVHRTIDGDAYFPTIDDAIWERTGLEPHDGYSYARYVRRT